MSANRRSRRRGLLPATTVAAAAHLLALWALGWQIPKAPQPLPPDTLPPVEIELLRPPAFRPAAPSSAGRASPGSARQNPSPLPTAPISEPSTKPPAPQSSAPPSTALATGPADCEPEDLPLLTEAEKTRCRNQIDADNARRYARGADERAAKQVAQAQIMAPTHRMDTEKEAYYAAVAQAYWEMSSDGPKLAGHLPGPVCILSANGIPLLSGVETNKNIFAKKKPERRPPHSLKLGPLPCNLVPPRGPFTPEVDLDPLGDQWRAKP